MVEDVVVKKFTFAISSPDKFLVYLPRSMRMHFMRNIVLERGIISD